MSNLDLKSVIKDITKDCVSLKNKYTSEKDLKVDYVCLFSHSQEEYDELVNSSSKLGTVVKETTTGPMFKLSSKIITVAGSPNVLKIRTPDKIKWQRGDVYFTTSYQEFKRKYFDNKRFTLISREKFEMLELRDDNFDVLVYFSNIPPSKLV